MADPIMSVRTGYEFKENDPNELLTFEKLNRMMNYAYVEWLSGVIGTTLLGDGAVTAAKLASSLDLSAKTLTLPTKSATDEQFRSGTGAPTPDSAGQVGVASDTGNIYIAKGTTTADWVYSGIVAVQSVAQIPNYTGQIAYENSIIYVATGTSAASDWQKILPINALQFEDNSGDPTGVASNLTVWCKQDGSSNLQLYFRRGTGAVTQLTGSDPVQGGTAPDWDSGWTAVANDTDYDLHDTSAGGFSNSQDISGVTGYNPTTDYVGFRIIHVYFRKTGTTAFLQYSGSSDAMQDGTTGWYIYYDPTNDKLRLQTSLTYVWQGVIKAATQLATEWTESGNTTLASGDLRIKGWI